MNKETTFSKAEQQELDGLSAFFKPLLEEFDKTKPVVHGNHPGRLHKVEYERFETLELKKSSAERCAKLKVGMRVHGSNAAGKLLTGTIVEVVKWRDNNWSEKFYNPVVKWDHSNGKRMAHQDGVHPIVTKS